MDWEEHFTTYPLDNSFKFQDRAPNAKYLRNKVRKGIGPDNMDPRVVKILPDRWLCAVVSCAEQTIYDEQVMMGEWN
eukprot:415759-Amphidinium_carterae.1